MARRKVHGSYRLVQSASQWDVMNGYKIPPDTKRGVAALVDVSNDLLTVGDKCGIRPAKRQTQIDLVPGDKWI